MAEPERIVCESGDLVDGGQGVRFLLGEGRLRVNGFVIRHEGVVRGFVNRCRHLPVELDSVHGKFFDSTSNFLVCSLHGAAYSPSSGECLWGPCDRKALAPIYVLERAGKVIVDWKPQTESSNSKDE